MNGSAQEPAPAPEVRTAQGVAQPARAPEPSKPASVPTLDRPHDDHVDEPGYGHGV